MTKGNWWFFSLLNLSRTEGFNTHSHSAGGFSSVVSVGVSLGCEWLTLVSLDVDDDLITEVFISLSLFVENTRNPLLALRSTSDANTNSMQRRSKDGFLSSLSLSSSSILTIFFTNIFLLMIWFLFVSFDFSLIEWVVCVSVCIAKSIFIPILCRLTERKEKSNSDVASFSTE